MHLELVGDFFPLLPLREERAGLHISYADDPSPALRAPSPHPLASEAILGMGRGIKGEGHSSLPATVSRFQAQREISGLALMPF